MRIKYLVLDVDGTLTDGRVYIGDHGEIMKSFDIKDGYGLANLLPAYNITPIIITGRFSNIVDNRCKELHITKVYQGIANKLEKLQSIFCELKASPNEALYVGDDINDLDCMRYCGYCACPADAIECIKKNCDFVASKPGGRGAVREIIDWIIAK